MLACAVLACVVFAVPVDRVHANPESTGTASAVEAKKAEEAQARLVLEQMKIDLAIQVAEYVELGTMIDRTKSEIAQATIDLATAEVKLDGTEIALRERAIELYRGERMDMLRVLLASSSIQDLWVRANYLTKITYRDAGLITEVRLARSEALWLQESLLNKMNRLAEMQRDADEKRLQIESDLEAQEARAEQLRVDLVRLMWTPVAGSAPEGAFNPNLVISQTQYKDSGSMSVEQIQAFLEDQPGSLATYRARDHAGVVKPVSQMIAEAAVAWNINPKVILVKLQKEQSLLERRQPTQRAYDWALGVGKTDSRTISKYKGFGNQIWWGAHFLQKNERGWRPGITMTITGSTVYPANSATYSLFKYTPHLRGTMSFWLLYWRYFGDPTV